MIYLAIETSCDESSVAIVDGGRVLTMQTVTQSVHRPYGGVVPELAGRSHLELLSRLTRQALAGTELKFSSLNAVAATSGPGLVGSLLVGVNFARGLAVAIQKPFRSVHHIEAHLWSAEIEHGEVPLPFLGLLVSGGHTLLVLVNSIRQYDVIGETHDDALGEAYDKVGKLSGFEFPAGAEVDKKASTGDAKAMPLPVPMGDQSLDFSFSGLKTAFLLRYQELVHQNRLSQLPDLLAAFQHSAVTSVVSKTASAILRYSPRALVAAGGAAANSLLREKLSTLAKSSQIPFLTPSIRYCMDNAGMIGYVAWKLDQSGTQVQFENQVYPRWPLVSLSH